MADVKYIVEMDASGALKSIKDLDGALDYSGKQAGTTGTAFGGLWKQFAIGQLAIEGLRKGYGLLKDFVKDSIDAAIESEEAENNLNAALEITGRNVPILLQHFKDYASALQNQTVYNDEAILAAQALLLQLTRLDKEGIDRATKGAIGLASVMKIDLQSAATMVTKAMEGNYGALGRVGIRVSENLTAEQKQASLLDQLGKLYQRAEAEVGTFGGSIKQLNNSFDDMEEVVGGAVTKNESFRDAIKDLKQWIDKLATSSDFQLWLNTVIDGLVAGMKLIGKFAKAVHDIENTIAGATKADKEFVESQVKLNAALDRAAAAGHDYRGKMDAIREAAAKAKPPINEVGTAVHQLTTEEIKAATEAVKMRSELEKTAKAILDKYDPLKAAMHKVIKEEQDLTKAFKAGVITEAQYRNGMAACEKELRSFGSTVVATAIPAARRMQEVMEKAVASMKEGPGYITRSWAAEAKKWVDKNQETFDQILGAASSVVGQIDAIMQQSTNNKMLLLDKEYQAKLENIKNSLLSEEEKNKAIEALDAEYDIKRRGLQRKAAESAKGVAIANAIINVAEGITKALSALPPPFNLILAAITAAAGAIQIALIRAQPIPLAMGAIFRKPAMLSSAGGNTYEVAEAGEAEIVSSPRRLREAIMGKGADGTGKPIVIQNHIYIDGREIKLFITKTVRESGGLGLLGSVGKAMA
jgi:hypothetical protein